MAAFICGHSHVHRCGRSTVEHSALYSHSCFQSSTFIFDCTHSYRSNLLPSYSLRRLVLALPLYLAERAARSPPHLLPCSSLPSLLPPLFYLSLPGSFTQHRFLRLSGPNFLIAVPLMPAAVLLSSSASFLLLHQTAAVALRTLLRKMSSAFQPVVPTLGWARHRVMQLAFLHLASTKKLKCKTEPASPHGLPSSSSLSRSTMTLDFIVLIILFGFLLLP